MHLKVPVVIPELLYTIKTEGLGTSKKQFFLELLEFYTFWY
jgi:hypothetical protein